MRIPDGYAKDVGDVGAALDAAHICDCERPEHVRNGLLLRTDVHRLCDAGHVTVTPQYEVEVSHRGRDDFNDGESYLRLHGATFMAGGLDFHVVVDPTEHIRIDGTMATKST